MNEKEETKIDVRGAVAFSLRGCKLVLMPTFANLARVEQSTGKTAVVLLSQTMSGNVSVVDIAKTIVTCAQMAEGGELPKPWNHLDVGQSMVDEGYAQYVTAVITFLGAALSAKPAKRTDGGGSASGE